MTQMLKNQYKKTFNNEKHYWNYSRMMSNKYDLNVFQIGRPVINEYTGEVKAIVKWFELVKD